MTRPHGNKINEEEEKKMFKQNVELDSRTTFFKWFCRARCGNKKKKLLKTTDQLGYDDCKNAMVTKEMPRCEQFLFFPSVVGSL